MIGRTTLLLASATALYGGVVLDRVAVIVGKHVVKSSDISRDLRVTEFMNREPLNLGSPAKRKAGERLIDQALIRDQIVNGGYARPTEADGERLLKQLQQDRFGGSDARLREALLPYGVTVDQFRAQLLWQLDVLRFIDQRFRPGVLVTDDEVHAYYDQHLADLRRQYPGSDSFEALQPKIRASLEGERINKNFAD